jgi:hypothetical protein
MWTRRMGRHRYVFEATEPSLLDGTPYGLITASRYEDGQQVECQAVHRTGQPRS